jgi:hypothetical protein
LKRRGARYHVNYYYADQSGRALGAQGWTYPRIGSARAPGSDAVRAAVTGGAPGDLINGAHLMADRFGGAPISLAVLDRARLGGWMSQT